MVVSKSHRTFAALKQRKMCITKFRGFSTCFTEDEFFYGDLVHYDYGKCYIVEQYCRNWDITGQGIEVDPKSVGQFTGLYDKEDEEIYQGDIVNVDEIRNRSYAVGFVQGSFVLIPYDEDLGDEIEESYIISAFLESEKSNKCKLKIIGNVYENKCRNK